MDTRRLGPMLEILEQNRTRLGVPGTERCPRLFTADAGYCSEGNLRLLADRGIDAYLATGRERHHRAGIGGGDSGRHSTAFRHEGQVADAGGTGGLCPAQNHHRAGVRVHQAGSGLPAVPVARRRWGVGRIHPVSPHPQPVEAVARRHGSDRVANGAGNGASNNGYVSWNLMADRFQGRKHLDDWKTTPAVAPAPPFPLNLRTGS